jgi:hypothetical protein
VGFFIRLASASRLAFPVAIAAVIFAACGAADQASLPTTGASAAVATATATPTATPTPTLAPTPPPTQKPVVVIATPKPTAPPPPPPPAFNYCGAPANPWHYNFCGGNVIYSPPSNICSYFGCITSFWTEDRPNDGYVIQCVDGRFSLSGGEAGSPCSSHGGPSRTLYAGTAT